MAEVRPADSSSRPSLPVELHSATREQHHELNRQIMARLPLCMPPHTDTSLLYAKGMTVFGQIFFAFESTWQSLLSHQHPDPNTTEENDYRYHEILSMFPLRALYRTIRLRADLRELRLHLNEPAMAELSLIETESQRFRTNIEQSLQTRPYLILAYAWTMYLALFNGGRWIRKQLLEAGIPFWDGEEKEEKRQEKQSQPHQPLSFWDFEGTEDDGDDIKRAFKQRFTDATLLLTDKEKDDIISETKHLFTTCMDMVHFLDERASSTTSSKNPKKSSLSIPMVQNVQSFAALAYFSLISLFINMWRYITATCASWKRLVVPKDNHTE